MGRKPKLRASFYNDAQFLMRLGHAVEADTSLPKAWREAIQEKCKALAIDLMGAPERRESSKKATG
jgi:hypothetical protein